MIMIQANFYKVRKNFVFCCFAVLNINAYTVEPHLKATSAGNTVTLLLQAARQNEHTVSCKETLINTVTSLLQTNFFGPLLTILTGFHCNEVSKNNLLFSLTLKYLYIHDHL